MKNDISEYKLLGYYLLKIYERTGIDSISYENVKSLTSGVFKRIGNNSVYNLLPIEEKRQLIDSMIKKNVFRTSSINGKTTFTQVYGYEATKYISAVYSCDRSLVFKLPKNIGASDNHTIELMQKMYTADMNLQMQSSLNAEINSYIQKTLSKTRSYS